MKVTLDLDALLSDGRISQEEATRLLGYSSRETSSKALNMLVVVGVLAVVAGGMVLVPSAGTAIVLGLMLGAVGILGEQLESAGWGLLRQMFVLVGALLTVGGMVVVSEGAMAVWALSAFGLVALAAWSGSGMLAVLGAAAILPLLQAGTEYGHASYTIVIEKPLLTIIVYGGLAWLAHAMTSRLEQKNAARAAGVFARTALFFTQFGFWVGSLWGEHRGSSYTDYRHEPSMLVPAGAFAFLWAVALIGTGVWAARENRRWVVNLCAVFGMIHFYTQWFERLSGSAGTVLGAGLITLVVALQLRKYNQPA